jgi:hypothetical protein
MSGVAVGVTSHVPSEDMEFRRVCSPFRSLSCELEFLHWNLPPYWVYVIAYYECQGVCSIEMSVYRIFVA